VTVDLRVCLYGFEGCGGSFEMRGASHNLKGLRLALVEGCGVLAIQELLYIIHCCLWVLFDATRRGVRGRHGSVKYYNLIEKLVDDGT